MRSPLDRLISKTEAAVLIAGFATLVLALLLSLFIAQRYLISTAQYWDLLRVERYIRLCQMALESGSRGKPSEESLQKLRDMGLFIDVYPPDHEIPRPNPRYVPAIESVEAWAYLRDGEGKPAAVIRTSRHDINTRHTVQTIRLYTLFGAIGGTVLIAVIGFAVRRTIMRRVRNAVREINPHLPQRDGIAADDPLEMLEQGMRKMLRTRQEDATRMQKLLDGHSELASLESVDCTLREVNAAYCRLFGKRRDDLIGKNYLDLIPASDRSEALTSLRRLSRQQPVNVVEHRVVLADGRSRWTRWRDEAVFDNEDNVVEVLSYGIDITPEKELASRLEALQIAFNQMQSLAETGSLTWDFAADRMEWTPEAWRLLGLSASQPASIELLLSVVAEDERETVRRLFLAAKDDGRAFQHEFRAVLPDGSLRVLQSRAEVLADPKTKILNHLTCTLRDITALRDAEAATKRELRFREAVEQSLAAGIVVSDEEGRNLLVNPAFCEMTGLSKEELVGATAPYPYWPEEEIPAINKAFELAIQGKTPPAGFELKFRRKDGTRFDVLIKVAPLLESNDKQLGWLAVVSDISSIQQTRRELQKAESEARKELLYRQAIEQSLDIGIVLRDMSGQTLSVNPAFVRMVGFSEEELLAAHPPDEPYWPEQEKTNITKALGEALEGRSLAEGFQMVFQRKNGSLFDVLVHVAPLLDSNGKQLGWLGAVSDISSIQQTRRDLAKAESQLRRQLNYMQAIEKGITVGLITIGADGRPLSANDAYCRMLGYTRDEIIAMKAPYPIWPEEDLDKIQRAFEQHLKGETPPGGFQLRFKKKDGTLIDVLITVSNLRGADGEPIGVLSSLTDISPLKEAERRLAVANERLQIAQDVAAFGIWDWDPAADTLFWDANSFAIFGHPDATDAQAVWKKAHSEEEQERLTYELRRLIASGGASGQDNLSVQWPDGSRHEILSTYVIIRDESGKATRVVGINRDVTTELEEQRELRNAQERLAAALEGGKFGTFEHVFGLGALNWNAANYEIYGIDLAVTDPDKLFQAWRSVVGSDYQALEQAISGLPVGKNTLTYDFTITIPGTTKKRRVRSSVFVERDKQGHPVRLVGISQQVS